MVWQNKLLIFNEHDNRRQGNMHEHSSAVGIMQTWQIHISTFAPYHHDEKDCIQSWKCAYVCIHVYIGHIFALDKQLIDSARVASPCLV